MTTPKRALDSNDGPAPKSAKTQSLVLHRLHVFLEKHGQDAALWFSVLPHDCLVYLSAFFGRWVPDPAGLSYRDSLSIGDANGICFDVQGNLFVTKADENEVCVYDVSDGSLLRKVGEGHHNGPCACAVDCRNWCSVGEMSDDSVKFFDQDGIFQHKLAISLPTALALNADGTLLYVCSFLSVKVFNTDECTLVKQIRNAEINNPCSIAALSIGGFFLYDYAHLSDFIRVLYDDGELVRTIQREQCKYAIRLAADAQNNVYVTDNKKCEVAVYSIDLNLICRFRSDRQGTKNERRPSSIAISRYGVVAVTYLNGHHVDLMA
jgi:hypothetical protein